ncbi:MAG: type II toxin-antitoxin system RelE/ParE family toxin [Chitinophagaceae bacterium]
MVFEIEVRSIALLDIDEAINWYDQELKGLGYRFLLKLDEVLQKISENPFAFMIIHDPVRRALLKTFPYKVLYFVKNNDTVVVIAVIHLKRSKKYVKRRSTP